MITFKSISYKNILSTGNVPNTIQLNTHKTTLLQSKNGSGKSTIIDALTFCLFGRPFRNINKGQLINSINGKNLLVVVEFDVAGNSYKIIRGMKPNIFEIWKDNLLITQDAALKDYQTVLEQQILKMNYRTFCQVVILGSSSFVPFMQLSAANRREVIEDILDIRIFSTMNTVLKEKIQNTKQQLDKVSTDITMAKTNVENQQKLIKNMQTSKQEHIDSIQTRIDKNSNEILFNVSRLKSIDNTLEELYLKIRDGKETIDAISHANDMKKTVSHNNSVMEKTFSFFDENDSCPSCSQNIPHEHKSSIRDVLQQEYDLNLVEMDSLSEEIKRCEVRMVEVKLIESEISISKNESYTFKSTIDTLLRQNSSLEIDVINTKHNQGNIESEKEKLKNYATTAMGNINNKTSLMELRNVEDIASILLKDSGIKTAVIKEYIPTINTLIAKFLSVMDFFIKFELDENFNESIKSRYRDDFTYASFSEGEKSRIDLALLFSWREIARLKNSANTNLLLLDEILDNTLDTEGAEYIMNLLTSLGEDSNIIIISHNTDQVPEKFSRVLTFQKRHDFSEIMA